MLVVIAEPSTSLAGQIKDLLPRLRQLAGPGRKVTICFDRVGWSPGLFADITDAGFDLLTYSKSDGKGGTADLPADAFTTMAHTDEHGRRREYHLADTAVELPISDGPRAGQAVAPRQVTRRKPARRGTTRQVHILTSRSPADLPAAEVAGRMGSRWRGENYFRYGRTHFPLDSYQVTPDDPGRMVPNPAKKTAAVAAEAARDTALGTLRSPAPGQAVIITNHAVNKLQDPVDAAYRGLDTAQAAAERARLKLGDLAPDMVRLDTGDQADYPRHPDGHL